MPKKSVKRVTSARKTTAKRPPARKVAPAPKVVKAVAPEPAQKPAVRPKGYGAKDLERFRSIITEKRKEILEELESLKSNMMDAMTGQYETENSAYSLHMEQGTDTMEREKTFLFASREGKFLNYLDDALQRIENGTYGFCTDCGQLIDKERLEAVPHAQLCINCKLKKGRHEPRVSEF